MISTSSSSLGLALVTLLGLAARPVAAQPATVAKGGYVVLTAENLTNDLEVGTTVAAGDAATVRLYGRVPFAGDDQQVRIDGHSEAGKLGLGLDLAGETIGPPAPADKFWARHWVISARAELGTARYRFTPLGEPATSERHQSFSARALVRLGSYRPTQQWSAQLALSYDRAYTAAGAIGIVVPGTAGAPDTVRTSVVAPPSTNPALSLRVGASLYRPDVIDRFAFGLYLIAATSGADRDVQPWSQGRTVRGELWSYGFLDKPPNTRVGLALFLESSRADPNADPETTFGVLAQLRLNTSPLEY